MSSRVTVNRRSFLFPFRFVGGSGARGIGCARSAEGRPARTGKHVFALLHFSHAHERTVLRWSHFHFPLDSAANTTKRGETRLSRRAISAVSLLRSNESSRSDGVRVSFDRLLFSLFCSNCIGGRKTLNGRKVRVSPLRAAAVRLCVCTAKRFITQIRAEE